MGRALQYKKDNPDNDAGIAMYNHVLDVLDKTEDALKSADDTILTVVHLVYQYLGGDITQKQLLVALNSFVEPSYAEFLNKKYIEKAIDDFSGGDWPMDDTETMNILDDKKIADD